MIRFGIVGTGRICRQFAEGLTYAKNAELSAVCSRRQDTADAFAKEYGAAHSFGSYEAMAASKDYDIAYIGTPNGCHVDNVKLYLNSGKPVLCEKPLGVNAREVQKMFATAKDTGLFLMEGMWTRCFPAIQKAIEWVKSGEIGDVKLMSVNFGFHGDTGDWRYNSDMAGGALLDLGIYALAIIFSMLGPGYESLYGAADVIGGIDKTATGTLVYPGSTLATFNISMGHILNNQVFIEGTKGRVMLGGRWWMGHLAELKLTGRGILDHDGPTTRFEEPYPATGFQFEADHVAQCLKDGLLESPLMTYQDSLALAKTMDALRKIYGVRFSQDA
jgi:predicted dehydrogenase